MRDMKIAIIAEFFLHNPLTQVMYFFTSRYRHIPHESQKKPNILLSNAYLQRKNNSNSLLFTS